MDLHIIPECYIDTALIEVLVPPSSRYNHQKGCSTVVKLMKEKFADQFAMGIVDRDKRELAYASECNLVFELPGQLQLLKHRQRNHYLIFICPAAEKWLLESAKQANVSLSDYGLPDDFEQLKSLTKTAKSKDKDPFSINFRRFFKVLRDSSSVNVAVLSLWISFLKSHPYNADLKDLIEKTHQILSS
jgi:hypothetical protein